MSDQVSTAPGTAHRRASFATLALGSLGVVYGDIGTSPLYAFREATLAASDHAGVTAEAVLGVLSLIIWALLIIVTLKYVVILLNADNNGEGGTLSLMALTKQALGKPSRFILLLGMVGAALFYGDALITPAISVLSAVEGLELAAPGLEPYVVPLTIAILIGLFAIQSRGTAKVAAYFGPIVLIWFLVLGAAGLVNIAQNTAVLEAFLPHHAAHFLMTHGTVGLLTLGAVFLAVTGAEALYADLGHFGRRPIQAAWILAALPSLTLNYLGQGALVLENPEALENPFYLMFADWLLYPVIGLATMATIIASQAVITGAYSLTQQAIQLGLLPRLEIRHTSEAHSGQIFMPQVNNLLLVGVLFLVVLFQSSSQLATAYGIAVTGTMVVTACMAIIVIRKVWKWPLWASLALMVPLLAIDVIFLAANMLKLFSGGYVPLLMGGAMILVMATWVKGADLLFAKTRRMEVPLLDLTQSLERRLPHLVKGVAIFLTSDPESAPTALLHSLKHYKVLHEKNVMLTVKFQPRPHVPEAEQVQWEVISERFSRVCLQFGYMDEPNVPKALLQCRKMGLQFDAMSTSFFLSRRVVRPAVHSGMPYWQDKLFIWLARNANDATAFFHIPTSRVVEIGTQVVI